MTLSTITYFCRRLHEDPLSSFLLSATRNTLYMTTFSVLFRRLYVHVNAVPRHKQTSTLSYIQTLLAIPYKKLTSVLFLHPHTDRLLSRFIACHCYQFMNTLIHTTLSHNDTSIMYLAILLLFLVFFFVTLLHCYTRWFLAQDVQMISSSDLVVPPVVGAVHRLLILRHLLTMDSTHDNNLSPSIYKGLEPCVVSSIPQFVFRHDEEEGGDHGLECVICLSLFENGEKGRRLALCSHAFHVECIDMWLHSHTTCPVCRAPAVNVSADRYEVVVDSLSSENHGTDLNEQNVGGFFETTRSLGETRLSNEDHGRLEIVVEVPNSEDRSNSTCQRKVVPSSNTVDEFDI